MRYTPPLINSQVFMDIEQLVEYFCWYNNKAKAVTYVRKISTTVETFRKKKIRPLAVLVCTESLSQNLAE